MAFRSLTQKKYNGILEYYSKASQDKETRSLYVSFRDATGATKKQRIETLDLDEAKAVLADIKRNIVNIKRDAAGDIAKLNKAVSQKTLTLDQVADLYFEKRRTKENNNDQKNYANRVSSVLGTKRASKITSDDIQELQDKLLESLAPKTTNEQINSLRALFNVAVRKGWVDANPVDRAEVKTVKEDKDNGRVFSESELESMFRVLEQGDEDLDLLPNKKLFMFAKLLYHTGGRPAAIVDLKAQHIDFNESKIRLKAMKGRNSYTRKVSPEVIDLLSAWFKKHDLKHGDSLFYSESHYRKTGDLEIKKTPTRYNGIGRSFKKYFDKMFNVDIPAEDAMSRITPYSLRRTAGTKMYNAKGIVHAMRFLNHSKIETTMIYLNIGDDVDGDLDVL